MLALKYMLLIAAIGMWAVSAGLLIYDLYFAFQTRRRPSQEPAEETAPRSIRWGLPARFAALALAPLLLSLSIVVVPAGMAAVRVSQISGTRPGTLYPGVHFIRPLIEHTVNFDTRDRVYTTAVPREIKAEGKMRGTQPEPLQVQSREGLNIGLAVTVRYRLDPRKLDYIEANLPKALEVEVVQPTIASSFREMAPNYTVRDIFSAHREQIREQAARTITSMLARDGVIVKEVMLRDVQLPPEYAKGLESLLLKEQENDRMGVETEIKAKNVRIAELEAEAAKAQQVKEAEAQAAVRVLQAKGESDAMQYMLPLKQKQIEQSRLEAEARKEATIKNAEAAAEAKVIDSKAELQRRNLLADAEANRIRITAAADAERMKEEGVVLKQNPLLINKIIAEKLSDKIQIMMVPTDGKFFFNDLFRNGFGVPAAQGDDPPETNPAALRANGAMQPR